MTSIITVSEPLKTIEPQGLCYKRKPRHVSKPGTNVDKKADSGKKYDFVLIRRVCPEFGDLEIHIVTNEADVARTEQLKQVFDHFKDDPDSKIVVSRIVQNTLVESFVNNGENFQEFSALLDKRATILLEEKGKKLMTQIADNKTSTISNSTVVDDDKSGSILEFPIFISKFFNCLSDSPRVSTLCLHNKSTLYYDDYSYFERDEIFESH